MANENQDEEEEIFINEELNIFKDNPIKKISISMQDQGTSKDRKLIGSYLPYTVFKTISEGGVPTLQNNLNDLVELINLISNYSSNVKNTTATYMAGKGIDEIDIKLEYTPWANYFVLPTYGAFLYPNNYFFGYHYGKYPKSSLFKIFQATEIKLGYDFTQGEKSIMFHQFIKEYKGIHTEFIEAASSRVLWKNAREIKRTSSFIFKKYITDPSILFPYHSYADTRNHYFLELASKRIKFDVDIKKASAELLKQTLNQQKLFSIKVGIFGSNFEDTFFENGFTNEISAEYNIDPIAKNYTHLRAHFRKFFTLDNYNFQFHLKCDKTLGETDHKIWIRNFKGVKDVGKKYYKSADMKEDLEKNRLPQGDPIGHTWVFDLGIKVSTSDLPYFNLYQIQQKFWTMRPFLFANCAVLADEFVVGNSLYQNFKDNSVFGTGFGFQIIHPYVCAELYYNVRVAKHNYEFGTELQFNFGLD